MSDRISSDSIAQDQLRAFIERIERMEEEKKAISDDIKEIYAEAKGNGFDTKVLRQIIRIRKMDHNERMEQEALLDLYMGALGMAPMPLFDDEDDEPPRGGRRQPEHRADATGLRQIGSVASGIVANLEPLQETQQFTPPAQTVPSVEAERQPDNTEPTGTVGSLAEEVTPPISSAPIQPASSVPDAAAQTVAVADPAAPTSSTEHEAVESSATLSPQPSEAGLPVATAAGSHVPHDAAIAEAGTPDSPAFSSADEADTDEVSAFAGATITGESLQITPVANQALVGPNSLGSAAGQPGEAGGVSPSASPAPTKLKMNPEFFGEPDPHCQRPAFCGGNSAIALCDACKAAAGIAHDGPTFQPEASVH